MRTSCETVSIELLRIVLKKQTAAGDKIVILK